jgi:hypothetical protein
VQEPVAVQPSYRVSRPGIARGTALPQPRAVAAASAAADTEPEASWIWSASTVSAPRRLSVVEPWRGHLLFLRRDLEDSLVLYQAPTSRQPGNKTDGRTRVTSPTKATGRPGAAIAAVPGICWQTTSPPCRRWVGKPPAPRGQSLPSPQAVFCRRTGNHRYRRHHRRRRLPVRARIPRPDRSLAGWLAWRHYARHVQSLTQGG